MSDPKLARFNAALAKNLASAGEDFATFGADPGTPGIITTTDPSPGAGDLKIHDSPALSGKFIGRARRGLSIFITGDKVSSADHPAGWYPVTVPEAFDASTGLNSIGALNGYAAADYIQTPGPKPVVPPSPVGPSPAPSPKPGGAPAKPAGGPSLGAIALGIAAVGAAGYGGKKLWDKYKR